MILAVYFTSISFQSVEAAGAAPLSLPYTACTMASGRQLKLTNRANFFTDPAFADLVNNKRRRSPWTDNAWGKPFGLPFVNL